MTGIDAWYDWGYFIFNCDNKMGEIWDFPNSLAFLPRDNLTRRSSVWSISKKIQENVPQNLCEIRMKTSNPGKCLDSLILSHQVTL